MGQSGTPRGSTDDGLLCFKDRRKLQACYVRVLRSALNLHNTEHGERTTDAEVLSRAQLLDACTVLRCARLHYFRRLLTSDQHRLVAFIVAVGARNHSWLAAILDDFKWLADVLPGKFAEIATPATNLVEWLRVALSPAWKRYLLLAKDAMKGKLSDCGIVSAGQSEITDSHFCYQCARSFSSVTDLRSHARRVHGYISLTRRYCPVNTCLACLVSFGSRYRVVQHLQDRKTCLALLQSVYEPMTAEDVKALDVRALAMSKARERIAPAMRVQGPMIDVQLAAMGRRILSV